MRGRVPRSGQLEKEHRRNLMRLWVFLLIVAAWVVLQAYVLPKLGIST
ncbi:MAG: hypothetical protein JRJ16_18460 [Deltaproteobacteria bacterium]|nr:hypothetical protein [Deltaproteobacteria bacterium]